MAIGNINPKYLYLCPLSSREICWIDRSKFSGKFYIGPGEVSGYLGRGGRVRDTITIPLPKNMVPKKHNPSTERNSKFISTCWKSINCKLEINLKLVHKMDIFNFNTRFSYSLIKWNTKRDKITIPLIYHQYSINSLPIYWINALTNKQIPF